VAHVDDVARALLVVVEETHPGVFNVASDGWLPAEDANALHPRRHLPGLPAEAAERVLQVLWNTGFGDAPAAVVPYLTHPWVVANDRMRETGWAPEYSNEEAILLTSPPPASGSLPWIAAALTATVGALGTGWLLARRRRRARQLGAGARFARCHSSQSDVK
jgi:hypothetical protein